MNPYAKSMVSDRTRRDALIAEHLPIARRIARRIARHLPSERALDDVLQAAYLGLAQAAERFDPHRGEPFLAFAELRIRGAVLDELRRGDILSRRSRVLARRIGRTITALEHTLGRPPEDEEVARALDVSVEVYREELEALTRVAFVDFDEQAADGPPVSRSFELPHTAMESSETIETLRTSLQALPERDATLLSLYYVEELTYAEIGQVLGVSESRICQLHGRAIARLKSRMDAADEPRRHPVIAEQRMSA